ncbi:hypothetical protein [Azospirillum soli]|uniref:hypothetical protein n=1 Tax=Azospirillum soli TaxID=1304799 RepID=UPI001AE9B454|nr:hypothetical protein [Azospirillum soli]MBP2316564.1 putative methyltransferase (TIGR04325 family) [Azospirillum soli]
MVPPVRYYCSYFDHRYLPRGLVLMESIWAYNPAARFFVLCFDEECKRLLDRIAHPNITAIPLAELEAADPELLAAKANRSLVEYYFTCTPSWPSYLLDRFPEIDLITYLDADLWFFADPETVHEEIGDASVAIIPHRFSSERRHLAKFGLFNVGWVSWRNDEEGRRCLADYRTDCIAWCYDRLEGARFADQKYLDSWPTKYPRLHVVEHIGANLAGWNINNHSLSMVDGILFFGDKRVVFYHYHALRETPDGRWNLNIDNELVRRHPLLVEAIYRPYVERLKAKGAELEERYGPIQKYTDIRYTREQEVKVKPVPTSGWVYVGAEWPAPVDPQSGGWSFKDIADIRRKQIADFRKRPPVFAAGDTILEQANTLIPAIALHHAQARRHGAVDPVSVLDWGGAIGLTAEVLRLLVPAVPLTYTVKEVDDICRIGAELMPGIAFINDQDKALAARYDLVIASGALHYSKDWMGLAAGLADASRNTLLIARQPTVRDMPSYVARQYAYGTAFTCWILNEREVVETFRRRGFEVVQRFLSGDACQIEGAPKQPTFHSYLLERVRDVPVDQP